MKQSSCHAVFKPLRLLCGCVPQRYVLAAMCSLAILNSYTMRVALNMAITVMTVPRNRSSSDAAECPAAPGLTNHTLSTRGEFEWDQGTQGVILSSFFYGYVVTHLPGGLLATRFGGKYTLGFGILLTAAGTFLTPLAARVGGSAGVIAVRVVEGLGEGACFPAVNVLLANWAPMSEKSTLSSLAFAGALLGNVLGTSLSGVVLDESGSNWPDIFYLFGGLATAWCLLFFLTCFDSPRTHPYITPEELAFLESHVEGIANTEVRPPPPWRAIMTSVPLLGLIVAQIGHDWIFFTMVTDLPKYMSDVMKFNIKENAIYSSLPYIVTFVVSVLAGWVADKVIQRRYLSTTNTRKLFTTIASVGPAMGVIAASYAGCDQVTVVVLFCLAMGLMGTFYAGIKVNALDLSPNHAGLLMALVNGIGAVSGIIVPHLIGLLTPESTLDQWRLVFFITAAVTIATNLVFVLTASGELQPWNSS